MAKKKPNKRPETKAKTTGIFQALRRYMVSKKDHKSVPPKKAAKTVRVDRKTGLSLVLKRFAQLGRTSPKPDLLTAVTTLKAAAPTLEVKKKPSASQKKPSAKKAKSKPKSTKKKTKKKAGETGMFTKELDVALESYTGDEIDISLPEPDFDDTVEIPESLLDEAKDLEVVAKSLSAEELEEAAKFLGVFGGSVNLEKFADYADALPELSDKEQQRRSAKTKRQAKRKQRDHEQLQQLEASAGLLGQLRDTLDRLTSITSAFDPQKLKGLLSLLSRNADKLEKLPDLPANAKIVTTTKAASTAAVSEADGGELDPTVLADGQVEAASDAPQASSDPTQIENVKSTGAVADTDEPNELDLKAEMEAEGFLESTTPAANADASSADPTRLLKDMVGEDGKPLSKKEQRALAKQIRQQERQAAKEAKKQRKKNRDRKADEEAVKSGDLGIAIEGLGKKEDDKKVNTAELADDIAEEDFLESTVQTTEPALQAVSGAPVSARERRRMEREAKEKAKTQDEDLKVQTKKERAEEKRWAEEAKRREKLLEEKRKKSEEAKKQMAKGEKVRIKVPKQKKKQNALQAFFTSLNYMGMDKERTSFIENLGTMMDAGLPLLDAINSLKNETKNKQMKKVLLRIVTAIELGSPLWRAMEGQYFFKPQQVSMVRVGEEAGNLVENLQYLAIQEEKDRGLRSKVKTAMIYPIIIFTMLTGIVLGLGIFVLPNLIQVIFSLGVPLPFVTRMIVKFTNFFTDYGSVAIPSFLGGMVVFFILAKYTAFKVVVQWGLFKLPGIGVLMREATLSRFGVVMGGLLQAGVPVTEALESVANVTGVVRYKKFYYQVLEHVKLGDSFATSFAKIRSTKKCFPPGMQQLIVTGEKSGSLTKVMGKIASIHEKRASDVAEKLPVILEPMLLLFIGALVGTIALGILAPIYSVVGNVGG